MFHKKITSSRYYYLLCTYISTFPLVKLHLFLQIFNSKFIILSLEIKIAHVKGFESHMINSYNCGHSGELYILNLHILVYLCLKIWRSLLGSISIAKVSQLPLVLQTAYSLITYFPFLLQNLQLI